MQPDSSSTPRRASDALSHLASWFGRVGAPRSLDGEVCSALEEGKLPAGLTFGVEIAEDVAGRW